MRWRTSEPRSAIMPQSSCCMKTTGRAEVPTPSPPPPVDTCCTPYMRGFLVQPDSLCLADTGGACTVFRRRRRRRRRRTNCCRAFSSRPLDAFLESGFPPPSLHHAHAAPCDGRTDGSMERETRARVPAPSPRLEPVHANRRTLRVCCPAGTEPWMPAGKKVWSQCTTTERAAWPCPAAFFSSSRPSHAII